MKLQLNQWIQILDKGLGVRSCSSYEACTLLAPDPNASSCASYCMDSPPSIFNYFSYNMVLIVPLDWENALKQTLTKILGFYNSNDRYLCIVNNVRGTSDDYDGCFAKTSSRYEKVLNSISLRGKNLEHLEELTNWVIEHIPDH